jgi:hypothetical protein
VKYIVTVCLRAVSYPDFYSGKVLCKCARYRFRYYINEQHFYLTWISLVNVYVFISFDKSSDIRTG